VTKEARAVSPIGNSNKFTTKKSILLNKDSLIRGSMDVLEDQR